MTTKKRILMCAESHNINSGFGRYTKEILSRLHATNKYELAEFGSYVYDDYISDVPWKVYPNVVRENHKDFQLYQSNPINQFGQWRFDRVVLHFKPDIVFDIRDYWMFSYQEMSPLRDYFHWIIAPTIDSVPQKTEWLTTFQNADLVLTHTDWAMNYLKSTNRKINTGLCVTDSVDTKQFKPVSWTKTYHKAIHGLPSDSIVIGSVMRNQKRKLIAELFSSLKSLIQKTNNKIFLYLHTSYPENPGWDIPELLQEYGVYNNVLFTYYNPQHKRYHCSLFKGLRIPAPENDGSECVFPNVIHGVSNDQLSSIYNIFDVYVQYAICEGLGIPQLEAASCGIPVFAINYSGMQEIIEKIHGTPLDHILYKEFETGSDRAVPINDDFVTKVIDWINLSNKEKKDLSHRTRKLLTEKYDWDFTANTFEKIFDSIQPKNKWHIPLLTSLANVPDNLSNRDFVYFIVDHILCEPRLKQTYYIQNIIKNMDQKIEDVQILREKAVKTLEVFLNNKFFCEKVRSGEIDISSEPYLNIHG